MSLNITPVPPTVSAFGTGAATSTGTIVLAAGNNITLNTGASSITVVGGGLSKLLMTQNAILGQVGEAVVTKINTITGTAGVGSSLFLNRIMVPAQMTLTEIQAAIAVLFPATSQGAGTMSRSMVVYSIGNNTSLASLLSASGSSSWNTGTSTAGASSSLTQFQGGWGLGIHEMTFASSSLAAGEYVIGQLFDFAQASSTWSLSLYGVVGLRSQSLPIPFDVSYSTLGALSSGGLAAVSAFTGSGSIAALSNAGTLAINNYELSSNSFVGSAASAIASATAISTKSFSIQSRTIFSAAPTSAGVFASTVLSAGSFIGTFGSIGAATSISLANATSTLAVTTVAQFQQIGTASTTSGFPTVFLNGIMSTGAVPAAITLTSTAVTAVGNTAFRQPWFALVGS